MITVKISHGDYRAKIDMPFAYDLHGFALSVNNSGNHYLPIGRPDKIDAIWQELQTTGESSHGWADYKMEGK